MSYYLTYMWLSRSFVAQFTIKYYYYYYYYESAQFWQASFEGIGNYLLENYFQISNAFPRMKLLRGVPITSYVVLTRKSGTHLCKLSDSIDRSHKNQMLVTS